MKSEIRVMECLRPSFLSSTCRCWLHFILYSYSVASSEVSQSWIHTHLFSVFPPSFYYYTVMSSHADAQHIASNTWHANPINITYCPPGSSACQRDINSTNATSQYNGTKLRGTKHAYVRRSVLFLWLIEVQNALEIINSRRRHSRPAQAAEKKNQVKDMPLTNGTPDLKGTPSIVGMREWLQILGHTVSSHIPERSAKSNALHIESRY